MSKKHAPPGLTFPRSTLTLAAPIKRWDEALPLGNGVMGALLWGDGNRLQLSLDRADLWDLRPVKAFERPEFSWRTLVEVARAGDAKRQGEIFEKPYHKSAHPTKIPAGRIELKLAADAAPRRFALELRRALATVELQRGKLAAFVSATDGVGVVRLRGVRCKAELIPPRFEGTDEPVTWRPTLADLGYAAGQRGKSKGLLWHMQPCHDEFRYALVVGERQMGSDRLLAFTITNSREGYEPLEEGRRRVEAALAQGFEKLLRRHAAWWRQFWSTSAVDLPDEGIQHHYELAQYFYGAASRRGSAPIALQGVWTADEGGLPPWKGDYHHDLNTQMTYWAYLAAGHLDEGLCFLDWLWSLLPAARDFARRFYGAPGACLPAVSSLTGQPLGGWAQYTFSPANMAWRAHAFYQHWRHTMDDAFLAERAYPWCTEVGTFVEAVLEPQPDGKLRLPISSSPEIHDISPLAWVQPDSNFDLALLRWLSGALAEMAAVLGRLQDAHRWSGLLGRLDCLHVQGEQGPLKVSADELLRESHRHHSHLMAIHPLSLLHTVQGERSRQIMDQSLHQIDILGTGRWTGYSFAWMSCIAARAHQSEHALNMLELYLKAFVSRNGFHLNGDFKNLGLSHYKYRPFTLEGNFAAAQAVHEMLVQVAEGVLTVFPAAPAAWGDVAFDRLRVDGGFLVSARRSNGRNAFVRIATARTGPLRLIDPLGRGARWNRKPRRTGPTLEWDLRKGDAIEGFATP